MKAREIKFSINGETIAAQRWGQEGGHPVIALHGWLDNCATFSFLAPLLEGVDLVAIDLAGHGLSYHRKQLSAYNIWQDLAEIVCIAQELGWKSFSLLGHSRGAMVASLFAATFPEKVQSLALIEALLPIPVKADEAPAQLASSILNLLKMNARPRRHYSSFAAAVDSRARGVVPINHDNALALAVRGVKQDDKGYYWANDYKVMTPSEVKFTPAQVEAFLSCVNSPAALIMGSHGMVKDFPGLNACLDKMPNIDVVEFPGDHYLHMAEHADAVAQVINTLFLDEARC